MTFKEWWAHENWPRQFEQEPDETWTNEDLQGTAEEAWDAGVASQQRVQDFHLKEWRALHDNLYARIAEKEGEISRLQSTLRAIAADRYEGDAPRQEIARAALNRSLETTK